MRNVGSHTQGVSTRSSHYILKIKHMQTKQKATWNIQEDTPYIIQHHSCVYSCMYVTRAQSGNMTSDQALLDHHAPVATHHINQLFCCLWQANINFLALDCSFIFFLSSFNRKCLRRAQTGSQANINVYVKSQLKRDMAQQWQHQILCTKRKELKAKVVI